MKKFIPILVILTILVSCRESEDLALEENELREESRVEKSYEYESNQIKKDTIRPVKENEPPVKDGNHWKEMND